MESLFQLGLLAAVIMLSASTKVVDQALLALLENRRQILVSPLHFRQGYCRRLEQAPPTKGLLGCQQKASWRTQGKWQDLCPANGLNFEVFSPRYYRLELDCRYFIAEFRLDLPQVAWELFR